jgi:hypothetical protein
MQDELDNPILEPSDKFYGVDSDKTEVPEETAAVVEEAPEEAVVESEELEVNASETEDDAGTLVYDIDGTETTQKQILEWKQGYLRQSDYTQKTQGVADKVKSEVAKKVSESIGDLDTKALALEEHTTALTALLDEVESSVDLEELRELDYEEYLKTKETIDNRRAKVKTAKEAAQKAAEDANLAYATEQQSLFIASNPEWSDDKGQATTKRDEDFKLISEYAQAVGFTPQEFGHVQNHKVMIAVLEAAKYRLLKQKTTASKKVKLAPKLVKPTQKSTKTDDTLSPGDKFYAKAKG